MDRVLADRAGPPTAGLVITPRQPLDAGAVARHYDELDPFYRALWGEHVHHGYFRTGRESVEEATEQLIRLVADRAEITDGDRVVDIGCGYGGTSRWLARHRGAQVTGLTLSQAQAEEAGRLSQEVGPRPVILRRDWLENGLEADSFDAAIAIESTTHMPDRPRVFDEIARVLRPGGRAVLCVWSADEDPRTWEVRHLLEPICREGRLHGLGSFTENREWLERAGLAVESIDDLSRSVRATWSRVAGRVLRGLVSNATYRKYLFDRGSSERIFAVTVWRLWLAYRTGALRYGLIAARKP